MTAVEKGKLIVVEGIDGSGKTTIANYINSALTRSGVKNTLLHSLKSGPISSAIYQRCFSENAKSWNERQLMHWMVAAHMETYYDAILPLIETGTTVVMDRFIGSFRAYQCGDWSDQLASKLYASMVEAFDYKPSMVFVVDARDDIIYQRLHSRDHEDQMEHRGPAFWNKLRLGYARYSNTAYNSCLVDTGKPIEETFENIDKHLSNFFTITKPN